MGICMSTKEYNNKSNSSPKNNNSSISRSSSINHLQNILNGFPLGIKAFTLGNNIKDNDIDNHNEINREIKSITFDIVGRSIGDPLEAYSVERPLFESNTGSIWLAKHKLTQTLRTMKIINKKIVNEDSEMMILHQINVLKKIDHPNIVKIFEFYNEKDKLYIVQEHGQGGQLMAYIIDNSPLDEFNSAYIVFQILCAIYYGHNSNIFHLDLKPDNIIIDYISNNGLVHIKIMDFGSTQIVEKEITKKSENIPLSSLYFTSPEGLDSQFSNKSDLWSVGIILYLLLSARVPFMGDQEDIIKEDIQSGVYDIREYPWDKISKEAKDLIKKLLDLDPESRITPKGALSHCWFEKLKLKENTILIDDNVIQLQLENLQNYGYKMSLQDAVLSFLVHNSLHLVQMRDSCQMFYLFDINNDGVITHDEIYDTLIKVIKLNEEESNKLAEEIMDRVDIKKVGYIEFEQFIKASVDKDKLLGEDILRYAFHYFDKDKSGNITAEELKLAFFGDRGSSKDDQEMIENMMKEVDEDGNGEIDFNEFVKIMRSLLN